MKHLGELFRQARKALALSATEIAQLAGYKNIDKGMRRYRQIENGNNLFPHQEVLERFRTALELDVSEIVMAQALDFQELDKPIQPYIVYRFVPGFHVTMELHPDCTMDQALMTAKKLARRLELRTCLVVSRLRSIFIDPDGSTEEALGLPIMSIGSHNKQAMRLTKRVSRIPQEGQHLRTERQS